MIQLFFFFNESVTLLTGTDEKWEHDLEIFHVSLYEVSITNIEHVSSCILTYKILIKEKKTYTILAFLIPLNHNSYFIWTGFCVNI